jgi:orotate phosphoribosyltransferase
MSDPEETGRKGAGTNVNKMKLAKDLFRIGALRFGRFTLSSGKISSYYLDLRIVPSYPDVYASVMEAYARMAKGIGESRFDVIAGVATAGVVFASPLALLLKKPLVYVRHEGKGHGLNRMVEGAVVPGSHVVVIDDITTTGGSIISAVDSLRKEGCVVSDALVLVERMEGGMNNLAEKGVSLRACATIRELLDLALEAGKVTKKDYQSVLRQLGGNSH